MNKQQQARVEQHLHQAHYHLERAMITGMWTLKERARMVDDLRRCDDYVRINEGKNYR